MPSADSILNETERVVLKEIALESIRYGLQSGYPVPVDPKRYSENLQQDRAAFVSLHRRGNLRGCVGSLEPRRPLVVDVAENAFAAAFKDARFEPLREYELCEVTLHISILTLPVPMVVSSEEDLLAQLQPGTDGLVLEQGTRRATFLPSVWEQLPEPAEFLAHLKKKAGLDRLAWDEGCRCYRYTTVEF